MDEPGWSVESRGYRPMREPHVEASFSLGNGALGVRASLDQPTPRSMPRTYVAGLFQTPADGSGVPALVSAPNWTVLRLAIENRPLRSIRSRGPAHLRTLDLRRGVLQSEWTSRSGEGLEVGLRSLRFVSLADRALGIQVAQVVADGAVSLMLEAGLGAPGPGLELVHVEPGLALWQTVGGGSQLAVATSATLDLAGQARRPTLQTDGCAVWTWEANSDQPATLARIVAIGHGANGQDPGARAIATLRRAQRRGVVRLFESHARAWEARWAASDLVIEGDDAAQQALRFAVYHLISAANPADEHVSIGARALTGDAYLGHVFWDTEIFLLPFYTLTWPEAARAMLMYRYHTLPAARAKATRLGYRGALYAWESADSGEETTPAAVVMPNGSVIPVRTGTEAHHISADIAYAIWQYWLASGDSRFLREAGAEILLETARFWSSRATLEPDGWYHIRGVVGPDEYHEGVDDNPYTNLLARWNLERGQEVVRLLQRRWPERWSVLQEQLGITSEEVQQWGSTARCIWLGRDPRSGVLEQFTGFFNLEPLDLTAYADRTQPMDVVLGREHTQRSQVIKQADTVMLQALLPECFTPEEYEANFRYYEPRCGHGSSLSPAFHALVAARLGDVDLAEAYLQQAAAIDLDDKMGNGGHGVHIATMGGLWQAVVFGFAGLSLRPDGLHLDPHLPPSWRTLRFSVQWRGRSLQIEIRQGSLHVTAQLERGRPMMLGVGGRTQRLRRGESVEFA